MKIKVLLILTILFILIYRLNNNNKEYCNCLSVKNKKQNSDNLIGKEIGLNIQKGKNQKLKFQYDTTFLEKDESRIEIISKMLLDSIDWAHSFYINPICVYQKVNLYKFNKLIKSFYHNYGKDTIQTFNGEKLLVLSNSIYEVCLRKGESGWFFWMLGDGGCSWCTTYHEVLNSDGKTIYLLVEDRTHTYKKIGNLNNDVYKRNKISKILTKQELHLCKRIER